MSVRFPESWSTLSSPHVRLELQEYLKEAADPQGHGNSNSIAELAHFIFDDHDFADPTLLIGKVLISRDEAQVMAAFVALLDRALGPRDRPLELIDSKEWRDVADAAAAAHAKLAELGYPTFQQH